jgi:nicotinamidase-related amidase
MAEQATATETALAKNSRMRPVLQQMLGAVLVAMTTALLLMDVQNDIDHLVLAGISTSGVVLSTVREAADLDYRLTVLADLCRDSDDELHRVLIEKVFPRHGEVIDSADWQP